MIARHVFTTGSDAARVAADLAGQLKVPGAPALALVIAFADWRIDPALLARDLQRACAPAPVVGCTARDVIGAAAPREAPAAVAVGFYGDWLCVGLGLAGDLAKSPLSRSRDAVQQAAAALGTTPDALDPERHVMMTLVDGTCGQVEAFCIGSAAAAPQLRVVGGSAATEHDSTRRACVWARGEAIADAGVVVLLDSQLPFEAVTSSHLRETEVRTVVTAASGRTIEELDGFPAAERVRALVAELGGTLDELRPTQYQFARFVVGVPYVRSMTHVESTRIHLSTAVEPGQVLRLMHPGDLIGGTRRDLAAAAEAVGGNVGALVAFSCIGRHWEAAARGIERQLAETYAAYPTTGFQSYGEQTGMLLVNYTLTGLAIGAPR